jgi:putative transposase
LIEPAYDMLSIARQCELMGLARSSYSYQAAGESAENLQLMRLLDEQYTRTPFYGIKRTTRSLRHCGVPKGGYEDHRSPVFLSIPAVACRAGSYSWIFAVVR